jgi:4'-phosphopantetheinyl transferase
MEMTFRKLWSLKEAFTKARGDGLGFPFKRCEFTLGGTHPTAPARGADTAGGPQPAVVETAAVAVDGLPRPEWRFYIQALRDDHWVSVARGPPTDAVDAYGGFISTFRKPKLQSEELARGHAAAEPQFVDKRVEELVPPEVAERVAAARAGAA